ncbi:MAG: tripartite tricarboxylate transporter permease [Synergistaceae bacterium]|nr:tripartite tricarboxylate transporter permease [Synergistaceae bacterium]MBQ7069446.1 tripartite tricarboxylate transporter permease [Synergistaceae bacterium]MBR0076652.1 tripartite tricarboxylate transporter permease [Synergistaceae bacterium]MBR0080308.1 tripartite tricarboxylate transporter permease [Synergistaceae bacterium]MBR0233534.1 tripartite tricarboxylate transporter permease [Synergistaceae bacterium]
MTTWELFTNGFSVLMDPYTFMMVVFAIIVGTIFGALPGVSATMAVALGLPFTYSMQPIQAIVFLVAVYCSSITGGSITAILFKIPGVPSSAPTTFDGYPMAQRGEAGKALGIALGSSAIGGLVSALAMLTLSPQLTQAALSFSPSDIFAITFMGLSILTCLDSKNILRTLISGLLGLLLACVGQDPMYAVQRLTFGSGELIAGLEMIPVLIGIFAVTEVLKQTKKRTKLESDETNASVNTKMPSFKEWWGIKWLLARCSVIGTVIGILPGAGATIASFLCYSSETKLSKHPEKFGTGIIDGIAASETANNAATGGAMVPLLSLGIPGGNAAAVMMSALVLKGVQLGPLLLVNQPQYLSATFASMVVTNILMVVVAIGIAKVFAQILAVPYSYLGPIIIMLAIIGSYATNMSIADVKIMAIAGVLGLIISACHFNSAALILGLVLGVICEGNFSRAYTISRADIVGMFSRPVAGTLMVISIILLVWPILSQMFRKKEA